MEPPCVQCPAAQPLAGPAVGGPSVLCGALMLEQARSDQVATGEFVSPLITAGGDGTVLDAFCCGTSLPVVDEVPDDGRAHYTACPLWRAERERGWERRRMMAEPKRRGATTPFGLGKAPDPEEFLMGADQVGQLDRLAPRKASA